MKTKYDVDVYIFGHFNDIVRFRSKWKAWLFHILLNQSCSGHAGVRRY